MAKNKTVVLDEIHVTFRIPSDLPDDAVEPIRQALASEDFMNRLRRAVRATFRVFPELAVVRVSLTR